MLKNFKSKVRALIKDGSKVTKQPFSDSKDEEEPHEALGLVLKTLGINEGEGAL